MLSARMLGATQRGKFSMTRTLPQTTMHGFVSQHASHAQSATHYHKLKRPCETSSPHASWGARSLEHWLNRLANLQAKAALAATMTLRASASSAATAEVSTPFWLSTFWTIAAALPEVACPSLRPECATVREPPARQQKHPRAIQKKRLGGSPVLLMKPAVPWQELIFGSASANSATTAATDARAASQRHAVGYSRRVHARANEQVCSGHAHAHARKDLNLSGLERRQLAA